MPLTSRLALAVAAGVIVFGAASPVAAQDVAEFYKGKTVSLVIGARPGSETDAYARLIGRHLGRFIPGNPKVAPSGMPGSSGHVAATHIYAAAAKDGTAIGAVLPETITEPLWFGMGKVQHDPGKFAYLGSANSESYNCFIRSESPIRSLRDAVANVVTVAATAEHGATRDEPALLNNLLGTKFRVADNYAGTAEILRAIENSEVDGVCGVSFGSMEAQRPDWIAKGVVRILVQENVKGATLANKMGAPRATDFARSGADREVMALAYAQQEFGRPYILPPDTPAERVGTLRQAFMNALREKQLLDEARTARLEVNPLSGEDVAALVGKLYATPPPLVERVRDALAYRPPQ
jgi:tripartite-type tricarboxylate transporter receptor subunit TctC